MKKDRKRRFLFMDAKVKHLEMIQNVIARMASNSFALKGLTITLVVGIFAFIKKDLDKICVIVAFIPIIVFWLLDSYYLMQERLYRFLYEQVRNLDDTNVNFSMKVNPEDFKEEKSILLNCIFSKTELWFYFPLAILIFIILIVIHS